MTDEPDRGNKLGEITRRDLAKAGFGGAVVLSSAGVLAACGSSSSTSGGSASAQQSSGGCLPVARPPEAARCASACSPPAAPRRSTCASRSASPTSFESSSCWTCSFSRGPLTGSCPPASPPRPIPTKDFTVWTLKLRSGVTWHDGKPFTADDVVYTIEKSWGAPSRGSTTASTAPIIDFKKVRAVDKLTVEVPLLQSIAQFEQLTFTQASHIIQNGTTDFNKPVGTGPFVYKSFHPRKTEHLHRQQELLEEPRALRRHARDRQQLHRGSRPPQFTPAGDPRHRPQRPPGAGQGTGIERQDSARKPAWIGVHRRDHARRSGSVHGCEGPAGDEADPGQARDRLQRPGRLWRPRGNDAPGNTLQYWASDIKATHDPEKAKSMLKAAGQDSLSVKLYTAAVIAGMNETATLYAELAWPVNAAGVDVSVAKDDPATYYSTGSPGGTWPNSSRLLRSTSRIIGQGPLLPSNAGSHPQKNRPTTRPIGTTRSEQAPQRRPGRRESRHRTQQKWHAVQELKASEGGYIVTSALNWVDGYSTKARGYPDHRGGALQLLGLQVSVAGNLISRRAV